jgi:Major capsid protein Gp23
MNIIKKAFDKVLALRKIYISKQKLKTDICCKPEPEKTDIICKVEPEKTISAPKFNWEATKELLLQGADLRTNKDGSYNPNKIKVMSTILDNFYKSQQFLSNNKNNNNTAAITNKIVIPILRRAVPNLIAHDLISVQAMEGPVQPIFLLKTENGKTFSLEKEIIEVCNRKLHARWTFELPSDNVKIISSPDIDIEAEIMAAMSQEICVDYDMELITSLRNLASKDEMLTMEYSSFKDGIFVGDIDGKLATLIELQATNIGKKTFKRGNWCIVNLEILEALKKSPTFEYAPKIDMPIGFAGVINKTIKVYVCAYDKYTTPILVGYKGTDLCDACAVFSPYNPIVSSGIVVDQQNFEPVVAFIARYGFYSLEKNETYKLEASDYLGLVGFSDLTDEDNV